MQNKKRNRGYHYGTSGHVGAGGEDKPLRKQLEEHGKAAAVRGTFAPRVALLDKELASYEDRFATARLLKDEMIQDEKERIKADRVARAKLDLLRYRPDRSKPWDAAKNGTTYYDDRQLGYNPDLRRMLEGAPRQEGSQLDSKNLFQVMDNERFRAAVRRRKLAALTDPFQAQMIKTKLSIAGISGNRRDIVVDEGMQRRPPGGGGESAHHRTAETDYDTDMRLPPLSENNYNSTANLVNYTPNTVRMNDVASTRSFKPYQRKG